ncbi:MAG: EAL domain-containing protein [Hyphomicrobiaceae bacterium]
MRLPNIETIVGRSRVAAKLYVIGILGVAAVGVLAVASIYFASNTRIAARHLYEDGLIGVVEACELEHLLERHRRIVEAAPTHFDRVRIDQDRQETEKILDRLSEMALNREEKSLDAISSLLPQLTNHGRRVLFLVANFAQDGALEELSKYTKVAHQVAKSIEEFRSDRITGAGRDLNTLSTSARQLLSWVGVWVAIAIVLIGPITFINVRNIAFRLNAITASMRRLAKNETDVEITSREDPDEIGDMARALDVFKAHTIAVLTQRKELKQLNFRLDIALNNMGRGLTMFDSDENLVISNKTFQNLYDMPENLCEPGTPFCEILRHRREVGSIDDGVDQGDFEQWHHTYSTKVASGTPFDVTYVLNNGRIILITYQPNGDGGCVAIHEDITEKRQAEEKIRQLAQIDTLTGLANRHYFRQTLRQSLENVSRSTADGAMALFLIDLDRFKEVNDTLGHPAGDALLKSVAQRLKVSVRGTDFVSRLGGDEFAIIQLGVRDETAALDAAERVLGALTSPFFIHGTQVNIGGSIGIALAPEHGKGHDEILKKADIALYRAKDEGRGQVQLFEREFEVRLLEKREIEQELQQAFEGNELELHYQPILDLKSKRVTSCEALMRWYHPNRGMVSPGLFIPLAEDIGLISKFGAWALNTACVAAKEWPEWIAVSVNLSAMQFGDGNLYETVQQALKDSGLPPSRLHLEVTESLLLDNNTNTRDTLHMLRSDGVQISLDDFGTGFASLSYLRSFPFDKIKIDQSFIRGSGDSRQNVAIVRAVADLAETLGMKTVAEGVETDSHLANVIEAGCNEVQGYMFSKPVSEREIQKTVATCSRRLKVPA